jgi:hypothetical protein
LTLWACLSVVLAHVLVVGGYKADDGLLALVADINTDEHGLVRDLSAEVHSPEITSEFGVDLSHDVEIDAVIISVDGLGSDELRDNRVVGVNFILNGGVEGLLSHAIWNDDQEELDLRSFLDSRGLFAIFSVDIVSEVGVNSLLEVFNLGLVVQRDDITVVDENVEAVLLRERVELVLKVLAILDIFLETEDGPLGEVDGLGNNLAQNVGIFKIGCTSSSGRQNGRSLEHFSLDLIRLKVDREIPLLDLLRVGDHFVDLGNALYTVVGLLEETLTDVSHDLLVLANLGRNADKDTELRWQIDTLSLLLDLEQRLVGICDLLLVVLLEVVEHLNSSLSTALLSLLEEVGARRHVPTDSVDLVGSLEAIVGHDYSAVEIAIYVGLIIKTFKPVVNNC